jgi:23S rRNA pseudouridine1911/1915/1917 synthase
MSNWIDQFAQPGEQAISVENRRRHFGAPPQGDVIFWKVHTNKDIHVMARGNGWLVVSKPAGLLVHPTRPDGVITLHGLLAHWLGQELSTGDQVSLVHRLDRETSGLMLVALTADSARHFSRQIERGAMEKEYRAIVFGWPEWEEREINAPILREGSRGPFRIWLKQSIHADGAAARTDFRVLRRFEKGGARFSLLAAQPRTGRMHQIRVHAAALGHALVGDKIYGPDEGCYLRFIETGWTPELAEVLHLPRHALHAHRLEFSDLDGRRINVTAPAPPDLEAFAGSWP